MSVACDIYNLKYWRAIARALQTEVPTRIDCYVIVTTG